MMVKKTTATRSKKTPNAFPIALGVGAIAIIALAIFAYPAFFPPANSEPVLSASDDISPVTGQLTASPSVDPSQFSKARYLKEVFSVNRDTYDIYEKSAINLGLSLADTKKFFLECCGLTREEDIFAQLPLVPEDFAEVAYDIQVGNQFQLANLTQNYYKQPEFHFYGTESAAVNRYYAFIGWINPSLQYWGDYALRTYPSQQYDSLSKSGRRTFNAVVFATNGWNIQNYVGINLVPNTASLQYFDLTIAEEKTGQPFFLLGPTFPVFDKDWATRIEITGTVKDDTPPGVYTIGINPVQPPKELNEKWGSEQKGLYTPYGFIQPSGNYIDLVITVQE